MPRMNGSYYMCEELLSDVLEWTLPIEASQEIAEFHKEVWGDEGELEFLVSYHSKMNQDGGNKGVQTRARKRICTLIMLCRIMVNTSGFDPEN